MSGRGVGVGSSKDAEASKLDTSEQELKPRVTQYPADDKPKQILDLMDRCRATGEFCDVQLKFSQSHTVYAHKAILCACSPYFEGMFTSTFMEATNDFVDMSHTTENPEVLESVINSFYGHQFELNEDNAGEILNLANMLSLDDLKEVCAQVMMKTVGVRNAAEMLQTAIYFQLEDLKEIVKSILYARFHDYIMFQEDLVEMGTECFDYLLKLVNTGFVSRKAEFLKLILNWFRRSGGDDRARVAINCLQYQLGFAITKYVYKEVEKDILNVIEHLKEANFDLSPEMRKKFLMVLIALKPVGYNQDENYDSDLEDGPADISFVKSKEPFIGPRTEAEGYTQEEEAMWEAHRIDVKNFNELDSKCWSLVKGREKDPNFSFSDQSLEMSHTREKLDDVKRRHNKVRGEFKKRNLKVKTQEELDEESRLLDMVVVLAPGLGLLESDKKTNEDDEMVVCAYVTHKKAWYKLGSLSASGPKKSALIARKREQGSLEQELLDPETIIESDMPIEMLMMMKDIPGPQCMQMMEMARMYPPKERNNKIALYMADNMPGHPLRYMMFEVMKYNRTLPSSLMSDQWKMVYLKEKLYFCNKRKVSPIWSYDLVNQTWNDYSFSPSSKKLPSDYANADTAIDMIVMGQTLYVVILTAMKDSRRVRSNTERNTISTTRYVRTRCEILKLNENDTIESHYESEPHDVYVDRSQFEFEEDDKDSRYTSETPMQTDVLKLALFREDDEKLDVFVMLRNNYRGMVTFNPGYLLVVYLDLKEEECEVGLSRELNFSREIIPLRNEDILYLVNDSLKVCSKMNLGNPVSHGRCSELGSSDPDTTAFQDAAELFPKCPRLTANNGRELWVLEGADRDISEMTVSQAQVIEDYRNCNLNTKMAPPPPFRSFSMACPGQIDRNVLRRFNPPTKYMHV